MQFARGLIQQHQAALVRAGELHGRLDNSGQGLVDIEMAGHSATQLSQRLQLSDPRRSLSLARGRAQAGQGSQLAYGSLGFFHQRGQGSVQLQKTT